MKRPITKYKKDYNGRDNSEYKISDPYKPTKAIIKKLNEKEQYIYEEVIINHQLDWENELEMIKLNMEMENK